jgi:transcriptional regulator with XRE-family HTH domain
MSIGQRISNLRKEKGYSQEYAAEKLNVSRQVVSKWIRIIVHLILTI